MNMTQVLTSRLLPLSLYFSIDFQNFDVLDILRLNLVKIRFSQNAFFIFFFHWRGIYCGQIYHKTCLGILILLPEPQKTAKNVEF